MRSKTQPARGRRSRVATMIVAVCLALTGSVVFSPPGGAVTDGVCVDWTDYPTELAAGERLAGASTTLSNVEASGVDIRVTWVNRHRGGDIIDTSTGGDFSELDDYITLLGSTAATPSTLRYWADAATGGSMEFEFLYRGTTTPVPVQVGSLLVGGMRSVGEPWGTADVALTLDGSAVAPTYADPDVSTTDATAADGLAGYEATPVIELEVPDYGDANTSAYNETRDAYVVVGAPFARDWTVLDWGGPTGVTADTISWDLYGIGAAVDPQPDPEVVDPADHQTHNALSAYIGALCFSADPLDPSIDIEKDTNGNQADLVADQSNRLVGDDVDWTFEVTNDGNTDLAGVEVTDSVTIDNETLPDPGGIVCDWASSSDAATPARNLSIGETVTCTSSSTVVAGQFGNDATVTATPVADAATADPDASVALVDGAGDTLADVEDSDPSHYFAPVLDLALRTTLDDGSNLGDVAIGETVTFLITVFNQGNVAATGIELVDYAPAGLTLEDADWSTSPQGPRIALPISRLEPAASTTVEITFRVTGPEALVENLAEITAGEGVDADDNPITLELAAGGTAPLTDADSTPDDTDDETPIDDEIDNAGGDEDDHDHAFVRIVATPTTTTTTTTTSTTTTTTIPSTTTDPPAPTTTTATGTGSGTPMASTGANSSWLVSVGVLLLLLGAGMVAFAAAVPSIVRRSRATF